MCACIYGQARGHEDSEAAQVTDHLCETICLEFDTQDDVPKCIAGDVNVEAEDIPTIQKKNYDQEKLESQIYQSIKS